MNNWNNYVFVYRDFLGVWHEARNPVFIASHKDCIAIEKTALRKGSVKEHLKRLNQNRKG